MSRQIKPLPALVEYFGSATEIPVIRQTFTFDTGWVVQSYKKRVSRSWLTKLKGEGVTAVNLELHGRQADFSVKELLA